jgi:hypothetical protein
MKSLLLLSSALAALLFTAACQSIDISSGGNPDRVLNGVVNVGTGLPAGAEVVVRLVSAPSGNEGSHSTGGDVPVLARPTGQVAEVVLGQSVQKLSSGTAEPVPFKIEYNAEDALLRRGLNLDVRVSFGGKIRYRTINAHVVTLASSAYRQEVYAQSVER